MLTETSGQMPDGTPFRIWVAADPVPGRPIDCAVIAVGGTILQALPVATVHSSRVLREIGRAIVQATDWTHEQHQAQQDAAQTQWERTLDANGDGA